MNKTCQSWFDLSGRRAVVTGAGRGIGRAIAEALAAAGAEVCVHYHSSDAAARDAVRAIESAGGKAWSARADLTIARDAEALLKSVEERWGGLDILVNNTGEIIEINGGLWVA